MVTVLYFYGHIFLDNAHTSVTTNTVVQIKQRNWSCWLFPWLHIAGMQTGRCRLLWTARVGGKWPTLAAIRSAISTPVSTLSDMLTASKCHADCRHVIDWSLLRRWRVNVQMYILAMVRSTVGSGPKKSVCGNRGYVNAISQYVLTHAFCMEKWRDREEAYTITEYTL